MHVKTLAHIKSIERSDYSYPSANAEVAMLSAQVKDELVQVSQAPVNESYGRLDYHEECEDGVNEQIK